MQQYGADGASEISPEGTPRTWQAGQSHTERFNVGVFGPALPAAAGSVAMGYPGVERSGNVITASLPLFGDGAGHYDIGGTTPRRELAPGRRRGDPRRLGSPADSVTEFTVPAQDSTYRLMRGHLP